MRKHRKITSWVFALLSIVVSSQAYGQKSLAEKTCFYTVIGTEARLRACDKVLEEDPSRSDIMVEIANIAFISKDYLKSLAAYRDASALGNESAGEALRQPELYLELYKKGLRHQNGREHPREKAMDYYLAALQSPQKEYHELISFHVTDLVNGRDVLGAPYISTEQIIENTKKRQQWWELYRKNRNIRQVGKFGLVDRAPEPTAGEILLKVIGAAIAADIAMSLSGQGPNSSGNFDREKWNHDREMEEIKRQFNQDLGLAWATVPHW